MFIKDRINTRNILFIPTNTEPDEDIGFEELDRKDRNRGCVCFGGHYVIRRDGSVETGRPLEKYGHYRRRYNKDSVFVFVVGKAGNFTEPQHEAVAEVELELFDLWPKAKGLDLT